MKFGKDSKYADFETLVVLQLSSFILKKTKKIKLESQFWTDFISQINMTSSPLVEESYAIVEYSDELVVVV